MKVRTDRGVGRSLLLTPVLVIALLMAGLMTAGAMAGAGPLAALSALSSSSDTETTATDTTATDPTDTTPTDTTSTEPTDTTPTDTTATDPTDTTPTDTTPTTATDTTPVEPPPPAGTCPQTTEETLSTDKPDYGHGETVYMSGTGYSEACDVIVRVTRPDGSVVKGDGSFEPGSDTVATGPDGALEYQYVLNGIEGSYLVDLFGANGVVLLSTTFTDAISGYQEGGATNGAGAFSGSCANPGDALTSNNVRAACDDSETVIGSEFGFQAIVPTDAVGIGFTVLVEGNVNVSSGDDRFQVALSWNGGTTFTAITQSDEVGSSDGFLTAPADESCSTFGRSWSYAELSEANFRVQVTADPSAGTDDMFVDDVDVRVCNDGSAVVEAAVAGGLTAVASPGATLVGEVDVNHTAIGGGDNDWESTSYQFEGESLQCVNTPDHTGSGTDDESFGVTAPTDKDTYDLTFIAYNNATCTSNANDSLPFTLADAVEVGIFGDSFGVVDDNSYTELGWTDGDAGSTDDCAADELPGIISEGNSYLRLRSDCVQTRTGISTSGFSNIHLEYKRGQETDNDAASDDGDLVVQWKLSASATWTTLNTHDLANNSTTPPTTQVDAALGGSASNATIDIRFIGDTNEDNDRARVDDVIVSGDPVPVDATKPDVTVNQKAGQADPTNTQPILFTAVFNEAINASTFTASDVTLTGTRTGGTASVSLVSGNTYEISVSGITGDGTVIASIAAGQVSDPAGNTNTASTSTDNTVTLDTTVAKPTLQLPANGSVTNDNTPAFDWSDVSDPSTPVSYTLQYVAKGATCDFTSATTVSSLASSTHTPASSIGADGVYCWQAQAHDNAGNNSGYPTAFEFTLDTRLPIVQINSVTPNPVTPTDPSTTVNWQADEAGTYTIRKGGTNCTDGTVIGTANQSYPTANATVNTTISASISLSYGANLIRVCVKDAALNFGFDEETVYRQAATTLTYTGDDYKVGDPSTVNLKGTLTGSQTTCTVSEQAINFYVDLNGNGLYDDAGYPASANTTGSPAVATLVRSLPAGIYLVKVEFVGTNLCAASSDEAIVSVVSPDDATNGGGWYQIAGVTNSSKRVNFGYTTRWDTKALMYKGEIIVHNKAAWRLKGDLTGFVKGTGTAYPYGGELSGSGRLFCWNSSTETWLLADEAVNFKVLIYDTGPPPSKKGSAVKPDKFTMFAITGYIATSGCPPSPTPLVQTTLQELKGGNIHIK